MDRRKGGRVSSGRTKRQLIRKGRQVKKKTIFLYWLTLFRFKVLLSCIRTFYRASISLLQPKANPSTIIVENRLFQSEWPWSFDGSPQTCSVHTLCIHSDCFSFHCTPLTCNCIHLPCFIIVLLFKEKLEKNYVSKTVRTLSSLVQFELSDIMLWLPNEARMTIKSHNGWMTQRFPLWLAIGWVCMHPAGCTASLIGSGKSL